MQIETEIKLNRIICGDSKEKLKEFPDNFFDGIVTDPPYGLEFMGKKWDTLRWKGTPGKAKVGAYMPNQNPRCQKCHKLKRNHKKSKCQCTEPIWDYRISEYPQMIQQWHYEWAKECLRVAKPGAFIFAFCGTRTYHRMACAIEDAGWMIRDSIDWLYGEGFPKSANISRQFDKEAGVEREKEWTEDTHGAAGGNLAGRPWIEQAKEDGGHFVDKNIPVTELAKQWNGYGTGLKPAHEPIIVAMKPLDGGLDYAQNAKKWGVAGLNIENSRIEPQSKKDLIDIRSERKSTSKGHFATQLKDDKFDRSDRSQIQGRWPANLILSHSPDCVCIGTKQINEGAPEGGYTYSGNEYQVEGFVKTCKPQAPSNRGQETIEVWACVPDCPIRILDTQSGDLSDNKRKVFLQPRATTGNGASTFTGRGHKAFHYADSGGASRFFYCTKAKQSEKEAGLLGIAECVKCGKFNSKTHTVIINGEKKKEKCTRNNHPTVKPLDLMKYLLGLIRMPSAKASVNTNKNKSRQVILDPFCGSGTTLVAAEQLGINYIGIDMDSDNCLTSIGRIGA